MQISAATAFTEAAKNRVNDACVGQPAWRIVLVTAGGTLMALAIKDFLWQDDRECCEGR